MATKKKSTQSDDADERRKKSDSKNNNSTKKPDQKKSSGGQTITYKGKTLTEYRGAPTEAFTNVGQRATGLAKAKPGTRGMATPKTPVKKGGAGFAGSGGPASTGMFNPTKSNIINAALTATMLPGSGQVRSYIARRVGAIADEAAFTAFGSKIAASTGRGGRVARTQTPFGPTLRSTAIGTKAQQSARIENLLIGVEKGAIQTNAITAAAVSKSLAKAGRIGRGAAAATLATRVVAPKIKNRNKKK